MKTLSTDNFKEEVLESDKPVLVDFYSTYCGPCRLLEPTLKKVEEKVSDVKFVKIGADDAMEAFKTYKVNHVPTMIIFNEGKEIDRKTGNMSEEQVKNWLTKIVTVKKMCPACVHLDHKETCDYVDEKGIVCGCKYHTNEINTK